MTVLSYTDGFGFRKIAFDSNTWQTDEHANWDQLDGILSAVIDSDIPFALATGASGDYVVDYTPNVTAYESGLTISFVANHTTDGTSTVNVDGLGAKDLYMNGAVTVAGDIVSAVYVKAVYDGTRFAVIQPVKAAVNSGLIYNGASGATAPTDADDLVIENNVAGGMSILTPNGVVGKINFGRAANGSIGAIYYDHTSDDLVFKVNGSDKVEISSTGVVTAVGGFVGDIVGNATTASSAVTAGSTTNASKWTTPRTISLTGPVTGSQSFDGSANFSVATTIGAGAITSGMLASGVALANLGFNPQIQDINLDALASLTFSADKIPYATGASTMALADFNAVGRSIVGAASVSAIRTVLEVISNSTTYEVRIGDVYIKMGTVSITPNHDSTAGEGSATFTTPYPTAFGGALIVPELPSGPVTGNNNLGPYVRQGTTNGFLAGLDAEETGAFSPLTAYYISWGK